MVAESCRCGYYGVAFSCLVVLENDAEDDYEATNVELEDMELQTCTSARGVWTKKGAKSTSPRDRTSNQRSEVRMEQIVCVKPLRVVSTTS